MARSPRSRVCLCVPIPRPEWRNKPDRDSDLLSLCLEALPCHKPIVSWQTSPWPAWRFTEALPAAQGPSCWAEVRQGRLFPVGCSLGAVLWLFHTSGAYYLSCHMLTTGFRPHHMLTSNGDSLTFGLPHGGLLWQWGGCSLGSWHNVCPHKAGDKPASPCWGSFSVLRLQSRSSLHVARIITQWIMCLALSQRLMMC